MCADTNKKRYQHKSIGIFFKALMLSYLSEWGLFSYHKAQQAKANNTSNTQKYSPVGYWY